jgi:putative membrane-bound dehydrogenase-like protein
MAHRSWLVSSLLLILLAWKPVRADSEDPPTPEQARAALHLADPALMVELVAAEPSVRSPVAIAWDERGRMYVAEMLDYPVAQTAGKIKRLEDRDHDGFYEHATTFAEGLPFPNGVLPWKGGVLVTAAPDIWFLKDTDDDGIADEKRVILTGFGEGNQQLRVNGLTWGLDNWVYGANGRSGGAIRRPDDPPEKAVPIPRHDFRFRPDTGEVEALAGFSQFGLPRDDWGNRFPSWNTVPIRHVVLEDRELARNPFLTDAATVAEIIDPADRGRVYSLAPPPATFNSEPVAFFNASCGPTIYRGDLLPESYRGDAFVCEPLTSLVHRRKLEPEGPTFVAKRVEQGQEFLASTHSWFRPVNLATGPDGALYVVDFCRAMVEHPAFVPKGKGEGVDFRRGHEFGRIWRVHKKDAVGRRPPADLASATRETLVKQLSHPNGWWRDTAQRLLVERSDREATQALVEAARSAATPLGRIHALATLDGLGTLEWEHLSDALLDPDPRVRQQGLRLAERRANEGAIFSFVQALDRDPDPRVRFRAALALGGVGGLEKLSPLARIATRDVADRWTRWAVLSSLVDQPRAGDGAGSFPEVCSLFVLSLKRADVRWLTDPSPDQADFLAQLGATIRARRGDNLAPDARALIHVGEGELPGRLALLSGIVRNTPLSEVEARFIYRDLFEKASAVAIDVKQPADRRQRALEAYVLGGSANPAELILALIGPGQPQELQSSAARLIGDRDGSEIAALALARWAELTVATRRELLAALVRSPRLAGPLLDAIEEDRVPVTEIDPATREALLRLPDAPLHERAERLLKATTPAADRAEVLQHYAQALNLGGDPKRGAEVFAKNCLTCHQRAGKGHRVGPDLASVAGRAKETLLSDILDPNREVAPDSMAFVVATKDGQVLSGLIAEESPTAVRLRRAEGVEESVPRAEITELRATGQSLMPVGLESALTPQDIADLIELLRRPEP